MESIILTDTMGTLNFSSNGSGSFFFIRILLLPARAKHSTTICVRPSSSIACVSGLSTNQVSVGGCDIEKIVHSLTESHALTSADRYTRSLPLAPRPLRENALGNSFAPLVRLPAERSSDHTHVCWKQSTRSGR